MPADEFVYGDIVHDREDEEPNDAVVVDVPGKTLDEWEIYRKWDGEPVTVADDNPDYPSDAKVVVVAYQDELEEYDPEWPTFEGEWRSKTTLNENDVRMYAFPPGRLERIDHRAEPPRRK
jgi:hypothetical protein